MNSLDRGRKVARLLIASAAVAAIAPPTASAQLLKGRNAATAPAPTQPARPSAPADAPRLEEVRVPTNTSDPIAIVNGEVITRQQLADECVARKGQEILDTLIARRLIEQAMRARKLEVTAAEIDLEIDHVAMSTAQATREVWLRTLDKERGISPAQYARDIIYPALALRKLAERRVQVTEQDIKDAFEANYGPRLRCRIIMVDSIRKANEVWEELRKNPAGFERIAKDRSRDTSTRAAGGMLPEPIARHAYPRNVSDAAFAQLVDGDPADKNPAHKPKDGDISGPIQVNDEAWIIMKREEVQGGRNARADDPQIREQLKAQMFDVKLKDAMGTEYDGMMKASAIDNKLTGQVKLASEETHPDYLDAKGDGGVKLMNNAGETAPTTLPTGTRAVAPTATSPSGASRPPAGVPAGAADAANQLRQAVKSAPPGAPRN